MLVETRDSVGVEPYAEVMDRLLGSKPPRLPRRATGRIGPVLLVVGLALSLLGCGDAAHDGGAAPQAAESSASAGAAHRYPACAQVWRSGSRLPVGYEACRAADRVVHDRRQPCSSGQVIVVHGTRWYAVTRGPVNRVAGDHPAHRMRAILRSCTG